jgi:ribonucleoside-diphosphate reductase alpha chain
VKVSGEGWTILVGLLDGKPYEIFGGLSQYVEIPKRRKKGTLIKNGKKEGITQYNLSVPLGNDEDDRLLFKDVVNLFENPRHGAWTRLMSLSLRHGIPLSYIVEQLQKDKHSDMLSFSRVIARVLKGYIPDGTQACDVCPDCGGKLTYVEGCVKCVSCSFGKCG